MPPRFTPTRSGVIFATLACGTWGLHPVYFKLIGSASAIEIVSHRMIWSMIFLGLVAACTRQWPELRSAWTDRRKLGVLVITALLLSLNLGLFVYGVNSNRIVEASLGNFIVPLVSVALGAIFLRERLSARQMLACGLAAGGVVLFGWNQASVPWLGIGIAIAFGFYGLLRKMADVTPLAGILIETTFMTPIALLLLAVLPGSSGPHSGLLWLGLVGTGAVTSLPLLWFNQAAKRLRLSTLGFFQYFAPLLQLLIGVWIYQEHFSPQKWLAFALVLAAVLIYGHSALSTRAAAGRPLLDAKPVS